MVKSRLDAVDVAIMVRDCRAKCIGLKLSNIYDINPKTFLFKLQTGGEEDNLTIVLESGIRFHTSKFSREKNQMPSGFAMKLRKHIRNKRLADVQQFNMDRVVDFMFGADDTAFHVILELYAGGNIILTDHEYRIMNLLRTHQYDESVKVAVREIYPIAYAAGTDSSRYLDTEDSVKSQCEALVLFLKGVNGSGGASGDDDGAVEKGGKSVPAPATKAPTLKAALAWAASPVGNISPMLLDHALYSAKIKGSTKVKAGWAGLSTEEVTAFFTSLREIIVKVDDLKGGGVTPGYIILEKPKEKTVKANKKSAKKGDDEDDEGDDSLPALASADGGPIFSGFNPFIFPHMVSEGEEVIEFASFADAVDEYFSKWEQQRAMRDVQKAKSQATKKVDKLKEDQERRLGQLSDTITVAKAKAFAIESELYVVDAAIAVVKSALKSGVDWTELGELVNMQKSIGNPVASLIERLDLSKDSIVLKLPYPDLGDGGDKSEEGSGSDEDSDEEKGEKEKQTILVDVNVNYTAYANIARHFDTKKKSQVKQEKTKEKLDETLKDAMKKAEAAVAKIKSNTGPTITRKTQWFEKFDWFISSEGYIVVLGKDAQQNEQLVKKYLRKGDIYVHADLNGASSCVVWNNNPETPIPPLTLQQAGNMTACRSNAWDSKMLTNSWWVHPEQVSKTAPTGEYLTTGSFMIRGKKNYMQVGKLEVGWGLLFQVDEDSMSRHVGERRIRGLINDGLGVSEEFNGEDDMDGDDDEGVALPDGPDEGDEGRREEEEGESSVTPELSVPAPPLVLDHSPLKQKKEKDHGRGKGGEPSHSKGVGSSPAKKGKAAPPPPVSIAATKEREVDLADEGEEEKEADTVETVDDDGGEGREGGVAANGGGSSATAGGKLSARDRRLLKRAQKLNITLDEMKMIAQREDDEKEALLKAKEEAAKTKVVVPDLPRGQRGKAAKSKKYKDQDDEDKELALLTLGVQKSKIHVEPKAVEVSSTITDSTKAKEAAIASHKTAHIVCFHCKQGGHMLKDCPLIEAAAATTAATTADESTEITKSSSKGEDIEAPDDVEASAGSTNLDKWTGKPYAEDALLFAIPMCAPYDVFRDFKYKVKLVPGGQKRGKASKQCLDFFASLSSGTKREKDLMKQISVAELSSNMISNCKVVIGSSSGATKSKKPQRGQKKPKNKEK